MCLCVCVCIPAAEAHAVCVQKRIYETKELMDREKRVYDGSVQKNYEKKWISEKRVWNEDQREERSGLLRSICVFATAFFMSFLPL